VSDGDEPAAIIERASPWPVSHASRSAAFRGTIERPACRAASSPAVGAGSPLGFVACAVGGGAAGYQLAFLACAAGSTDPACGGNSPAGLTWPQWLQAFVAGGGDSFGHGLARVALGGVWGVPAEPWRRCRCSRRVVQRPARPSSARSPGQRLRPARLGVDRQLRLRAAERRSRPECCAITARRCGPGHFPATPREPLSPWK
jgi:hypothetical protein